jgi:tRNA threonylcarbamoyladenosine biosynthesis protein TsaB
MNQIPDYILYIDTSHTEGTEVSISDGKKIVAAKKVMLSNKSENVLELIDKILAENAINLKNLAGIKVNTGPGSFTGLRVGIAVARSLALFLNIPVNGKSTTDNIEINYGENKFN